MVLTVDDENDFADAERCHICGVDYVEDDTTVRDHCHITSKYRGSAHRDCNINFRLTNKIPVIFHNLRGYDSHFIMQEIGKFGQDINVIPNNMEKYMAFMIGKHLVFLDSFQFMSSSLDNLVKNLPDDGYIETSKMFQGGEEQLKLVTKKGVYPYDYMDSIWRGSLRNNCPHRRSFIVFSRIPTFLKLIINTHRTCGEHLICKQWVTTTICI